MAKPPTMKERIETLHRLYDGERRKPGANEKAIFLDLMARWTKMIQDETESELSFFREKEARDRAQFDY